MKFPDLRFWRRPEEQRTITGLPWDVGGQLPIKQVSTEQALSLVPVFGAVRLLASQISTLPLQTYRKVGDGRVKIPTGSLFSQPSAHGTSYAWLHRCVTSLALRGNAYGLITARDNMGYPTMIEWLHPDHVQVQDQAMSGPGSYSMPIWYWMGRVVPTEDMVHIAWFTVPYRVKGLSPIEACASVVSTGVSAQVYTADWFNNGAVPPGKFKNTQKTVNQVESDEIKARLTAAIRSRKPLVYGADWEYDPIAVGANEARFIETLQLNATQIASIYGIPPEMLGGSTGNSLTYSTVEQNSINFVKFTLRPWLELIEETFSQLLPRPQYVKFNIEALLRGDLTTRMNAYRAARDIGLNNIDELRNLEEWAPIPDGKGKDYDPLLVQVAAARGTEAAQIKANEPPTDQPPADLAQRSAEDDAGPKGYASSGGEEPDENVIALLLAFEEFEDWLTDGARSWDPAKHPRNPPGSPGGGKFRSLVDRITDALKEHHKGGGKGDPFEGFSREQLRLTAKKRGIPIARGESRDDIAKKLLDHLGGSEPKAQGLISAEQYAEMQPEGMWSEQKRDAILSSLKTTEHGKVLADVLDRFQDGGSIARLRTGIEKRLSGESTGNDTSDLKADVAIDALRNAPTGLSPASVYRGMSVKGSVATVLGRYQPGAPLDLNLTSFSSDRAVGKRFQQMTHKTGQTRVMVELIGDDKRLLPIQNLARDRRLFREKEWVGGGKYEIAEVKKSGDGGVLLRIRQVGTL